MSVIRRFVAGRLRLVESAIVRRESAEGGGEILTADRKRLDLSYQSSVDRWFEANRPDEVDLVAGTVGGILANSTQPVDFICDDRTIHVTVEHAAPDGMPRKRPDASRIQALRWRRRVGLREGIAPTYA